MNNLGFLIYSSIRNEICTDDDIKRILTNIENNNHAKNLTGVLVHSDKYFVQFLEGDKDQLASLFENIKKDPRHSVIALNKGSIEKRMFPSFYTGYKNISQREIDFLTDSIDNESTFLDYILEGNIVSENKSLKALQTFYKQVRSAE